MSQTIHVSNTSLNQIIPIKNKHPQSINLNNRTGYEEAISQHNVSSTAHEDIRALIANLSKSMTFKGTVGVKGEISSLPEPIPITEGWTYEVISDGEYAGQSARVGDLFISTGSEWKLIPSGNDGTVTSVGINSTDGKIIVTKSPITTSGTIDLTVNEAGMKHRHTVTLTLGGTVENETFTPTGTITIVPHTKAVVDTVKLSVEDNTLILSTTSTDVLDSLTGATFIGDSITHNHVFTGIEQSIDSGEPIV